MDFPHFVREIVQLHLDGSAEIEADALVQYRFALLDDANGKVLAVSSSFDDMETAKAELLAEDPRQLLIYDLLEDQPVA